MSPVLEEELEETAIRAFVTNDKRARNFCLLESIEVRIEK
jgi:hypothetical protein